MLVQRSSLKSSQWPAQEKGQAVSLALTHTHTSTSLTILCRMAVLRFGWNAKQLSHVEAGM